MDYGLNDIKELENAYFLLIEKQKEDLSEKQFKIYFDGIMKGKKEIHVGDKYLPKDSLTMYRIIEYDEKPLLIKNCSYNPSAKQSRCNLTETKVFYGTNHIKSGIMESIIKSFDKLENYEMFIGRRFIIGQWELTMSSMLPINFIYTRKDNIDSTSGYIKRMITGIERMIQKKGEQEQEIVRQILEIYHSMFYGPDIISACMCDNLFNRRQVNVIFYPSAIKDLKALNFAIDYSSADNLNRLRPIKFNYCELISGRKNNNKLEMIDYKIIGCGQSNYETGKIDWIEDKNLLSDCVINNFISVPMNK